MWDSDVLDRVAPQSDSRRGVDDPMSTRGGGGGAGSTRGGGARWNALRKGLGGENMKKMIEINTAQQNLNEKIANNIRNNNQL